MSVPEDPREWDEYDAPHLREEEWLDLHRGEPEPPPVWEIVLRHRTGDLIERSRVQAETFHQAVRVVRERNLPQSKYAPATGWLVGPEQWG